MDAPEIKWTSSKLYTRGESSSPAEGKTDSPQVFFQPPEASKSKEISDVTVLPLESKSNPLYNVRVAETTLRRGDDIETFKEAFSDFPEEEGDLLENLTEISEEAIADISKIPIEEVEVHENDNKGPSPYSEVLDELDRLKGNLGGASRFAEDEKPAIDFSDHHKTFFKIPLPVIKDNIRRAINKSWRPHFFWQTLGKYFNVKNEVPLSKYEDAYIRVLRFGIVANNKEELLKILDEQDDSRYNEMTELSGLDWHPKRNNSAVEREYLDLDHLFFTKYFEAAKSKGDEALLEFFNTVLEGFCFEARSKAIEQYIQKNPLDDNSETAHVADWDSQGSVLKAFDKEVMAAGLQGKFLNPNEFKAILEKKGIFETEFSETSGRMKPTLETYHNFALRQVQNTTLDNYAYEDFLNTELELFKASGQEFTKEAFRGALQFRIDAIGEIELKTADDETVEFSLDSQETERFINEHF